MPLLLLQGSSLTPMLQTTVLVLQLVLSSLTVSINATVSCATLERHCSELWCIYIHIYLPTYTYTYIYTHTYIHTYMCTHIYTVYIHVHIIHTYIHVHAYTQSVLAIKCPFDF